MAGSPDKKWASRVLRKLGRSKASGNGEMIRCEYVEIVETVCATTNVVNALHARDSALHEERQSKFAVQHKRLRSSLLRMKKRNGGLTSDEEAELNGDANG